MRITVSIDGGLALFYGLNGPRTLDTDKLSAADATEAEQLVAASDFFSLPTVVSASPMGAADVRTIRIRVEDGAQQHEVSAVEPLLNESLRALVALVTSVGKSSATDPHKRNQSD